MLPCCKILFTLLLKRSASFFCRSVSAASTEAAEAKQTPPAQVRERGDAAARSLCPQVHCGTSGLGALIQKAGPREFHAKTLTTSDRHKRDAERAELRVWLNMQTPAGLDLHAIIIHLL